MAILEKTVMVGVNGKMLKYLENLGYDIPKYKNPQNRRISVKRGTKIEVKVEDLLNIRCSAHVTKICDYCNTPSEKTQPLYAITQWRDEEGKDCCRKCSGLKISKSLRSNITFEKSFAYKYPELVKTWHPTKNGALTSMDISAGSDLVYYWICLENDEHIYSMSPNLRKRNLNACPYCKGLRVNHTNSLASLYPYLIAEWQYDKNGDLTPYNVTAKSGKKVWWKCLECFHEWRADIDKRTIGKTGCPECKKSKGEIRIGSYLKTKGYPYISQFEFQDLKGIRGKLLKFDFAVFDLNRERLICIVEYDGQFHFKKQYKEDGHEIIKIHDQRKDEYCMENQIPLIRIPYWEFENIDDILNNQLKEIMG